eukprot:scaffold214858_cov51-Prasinocladus_malaysianus.AAC.1
MSLTSYIPVALQPAQLRCTATSGRQLVCSECYCWAYMDTAKSRQIQRKQVVECKNCGRGSGLRPRVMLYDDGEGDAITPEDVHHSTHYWLFAASTMYFREVRSFLMEKRLA